MDGNSSNSRLPPEMFESIFRYLNYMDLVIASKVCREWRRNAISVRNRRTGPYSSDAQFNSTDFDSIRQSPIKPFVGFFFLMIDLNGANYFNAEETICNKLPINCKTIMLKTYSMNFNARDVTLASNTLSNVARCAVVFALLPEISNVKINMVVVQNNEISEYKQMIETVFSQNHESFICIMLFYTYTCRSVGGIMTDIAYSRSYNNKRVPFCGGIINNILITDNKTSLCNSADCVAVLIAGLIRTWSIVLEVEDIDLAKEKLQIFKEQVQLQKYAVGFAFFTNEQIRFYNDCIRNELLTMFKQLFPEVSLIGCSCDMIFGRDTVTYEKKFLLSHGEIWNLLTYSRCIAFTVLSYG